MTLGKMELGTLACQDNLPNSFLRNAILPNAILPRAFWSFRSIIRLQFSSRYYKDVLKFFMWTVYCSVVIFSYEVPWPFIYLVG